MNAIVPNVPTKGRPHLGIRVDPETIDELDVLASKASTPLREISRSDVARYALERGIEVVRAEIESTAKPKRRKRAAK